MIRRTRLKLVLLFDENTALDLAQLRFNSTQLTILPDSEFITAAVDDSFPDGLDSNGDVIVNSSPQRSVLDVLDNDNLGMNGTITEFDVLTGASKGIVLVEDNGTPNDLEDDYLSYRPNDWLRIQLLCVTTEGVMTSAQ